MSKLAVKLYEKRDAAMENYVPLVNAVFGEGAYDPGLTGNAEYTAKAQEALYALGESGAFGMLQRYYAEEYFLHGKSKEEIGKEIAENIDLLLSDLETAAVRFLRHPEHAKLLRPCSNKEE